VYLSPMKYTNVAFKDLLRRRNISYEDLANELNLKYGSVKNQLSDNKELPRWAVSMLLATKYESECIPILLDVVNGNEQRGIDHLNSRTEQEFDRLMLLALTGNRDPAISYLKERGWWM